MSGREKQKLGFKQKGAVDDEMNLVMMAHGFFDGACRGVAYGIAGDVLDGDVEVVMKRCFFSKVM